jgi:hypothetical protein
MMPAATSATTRGRVGSAANDAARVRCALRGAVIDRVTTVGARAEVSAIDATDAATPRLSRRASNSTRCKLQTAFFPGFFLVFSSVPN